MTIEITVPTLGESITEATVSQWFKQIGDSVDADEPILELETDKVTVEVPAPSAGVLTEILAADGVNVEVGAILGSIAEGEAAPKAEAKPAAEEKAAPEPAPAPKPAAAPAPAPAPAPAASGAAPALSPAVRKLVEEHNLDPRQITGTGPKGRLVKADVLAYLESKPAAPAKPAAPVAAPPAAIAPASELPERAADPRGEEVVRMSRLRQRIAQRLKEAQNNAAMLSTFNEVDMGALIKLRAEYRDKFEKKHNVRLGFLSFFVKAAIIALKEIPAVNAEIYGDQLIYKNYYDIGVAVGTPQGLVVPVLRDADAMSFAEIEGTIADFGRRARDGKLTIAEMTGGTFTISNGGVFGSLLSMPILNPPQSGILGMHKIQKRPMVVGDEIKVCDMMYLALSYDHRIIDGREAVTFLVRMKECLEDPQRLLIDV
ncbi:MAG: 2-oxoglutarate dehydrogenase complex dihydrolipoyllysine-residue succinyltransferase [Rhodospirillaceae bacterium]|nr:2-oxoglutarate dehydrogenase complex dihydrolipoyllysine-residue succinyltransferase [Rhodospirillaceae bacterium]MDD9913368.1 2-oxoglutarate dehydrogenase complex dihydrolipoyllysine-residue succinyltransferase [Rhodospirillaceae bacterium]MDD9924490.1 2-oxoglutarate dehydrogenase complex dihydrolipoyllysine-residue succinyltransferase [Rhodospirillaceae bacterium]